MTPRPTQAKPLLLISTPDYINVWGRGRHVFFFFFAISIWKRRLITGWRWYISVARRKRIIFQWKPKPYCWECTIWISKGSAPTSIFPGMAQESARGGKTDWWWIMYILLANCDIYLAMRCSVWHIQIISVSMWQMIIFRRFSTWMHICWKCKQVQRLCYMQLPHIHTAKYLLKVDCFGNWMTVQEQEIKKGVIILWNLMNNFLLSMQSPLRLMWLPGAHSAPLFLLPQSAAGRAWGGVPSNKTFISGGTACPAPATTLALTPRALLKFATKI